MDILRIQCEQLVIQRAENRGEERFMGADCFLVDVVFQK
jgi:hypothetical protein